MTIAVLADSLYLSTTGGWYWSQLPGAGFRTWT